MLLYWNSSVSIAQLSESDVKLSKKALPNQFLVFKRFFSCLLRGLTISENDTFKCISNKYDRLQRCSP